MTLQPYVVTSKQPEADNSFILQAKPADSETVFDFHPGQYALLQNPFAKPKDLRPFSIVSSPHSKHELEFCIKTYGEWTKSFSQIKPGDQFNLAGPYGNFIWNDDITNAVFLVGGTGIAPIMSMLRTIAVNKLSPKLTLLYGNRTPETILYKEELNLLKKAVKNLEIVNIVSGFITDAILKQEIDFSTKPIFFVIGPPIFIEKMNKLLANFSVSQAQIKQENLDLTTLSRSIS